MKVNIREPDPILGEAMYEYVDKLRNMSDEERKKEIMEMLRDA